MWRKYKAQSRKRSFSTTDYSPLEEGGRRGVGETSKRQIKHMSQLNEILRSFERESYGAYKKLSNYIFKGDLFDLMCTRVQGDPYAPPSVFSLYIHPQVANFPPDLYNNTIRQTALTDYIGRRIEAEFDVAPKDPHQCYDGSVKGGSFTITNRPQQVLERSDVVMYEGGLDFRFKFSLPARGRTIIPSKAIYAFLTYLPWFIKHRVLYSSMDPCDVAQFVACVEDQDWIRSHLHDNGLIAFVPNGAILSRSAGNADTPNLNQDRVVAFQSPPELEVAMVLPSGKRIQGMGIPPGITVITGGGYHGKSTLLRALEMGVYNHIPGDGREYLAIDKSAIKIRSEDGRWIQGVDVSPFINRLPFDTSTKAFSTSNASGSTSMAASIQEMVEANAKVFLYDEDTCATNFLVSDRRMRQLISKEHEPITPLVFRIKQLYQSHGVSSLLVTGVCYDFLYLADLVIEMRNYTARAVTKEAKSIANMHPSMSHENGTSGLGKLSEYGPITPRALLYPDYMQQNQPGEPCKALVERHGFINFKSHSELSLHLNDQLVDQAMMRTIKCGLLQLANRGNSLTVTDDAQSLEAILDQGPTKTPDDLLGSRRCFLTAPLDLLCLKFPPYGQDIPDLSRPPRTAFIYALNRLRDTTLLVDSTGSY